MRKNFFLIFSIFIFVLSGIVFFYKYTAVDYQKNYWGENIIKYDTRELASNGNISKAYYIDNSKVIVNDIETIEPNKSYILKYYKVGQSELLSVDLKISDNPVLYIIEDEMPPRSATFTEFIEELDYNKEIILELNHDPVEGKSSVFNIFLNK